MTIPQAPITNVDDYIACFEPAVQAILSQIRATVRQAAPEATEVISYGMPALKMQGVLIYFAAFKHHIGFYPPIRGDMTLEQEAAAYAGPKGNLKFPYTQPMPYALMAALTRWRATQDAQKRRRTAAPAQRSRSKPST